MSQDEITPDATIPWVDMVDVGIEVGNVAKGVDDCGNISYTGHGLDDTVRVFFGICPDPEGICAPGEHPGWSATTEELYGDDEWHPSREAVYFEPDQYNQFLAHVASELNGS